MLHRLLLPAPTSAMSRPPSREEEEIAEALRASRNALAMFAVFSGFLSLRLIPSLYVRQVYDRVLTSRNETTLLALTPLLLDGYASQVHAGSDPSPYARRVQRAGG